MTLAVEILFAMPNFIIAWRSKDYSLCHWPSVLIWLHSAPAAKLLFSWNLASQLAYLLAGSFFCKLALASLLAGI